MIVKGVRGHDPPADFQKFTFCNEHFSAFRTVCNANFVLLPLVSFLSNMWHIVCLFSIYAWLDVRIIVKSKRFEIMEKCNLSKTF